MKSTETMSFPRLRGLVAAAFTPMHADGRLNCEVIPAYVDRLVEEGIAGLYVCGSTGEGVSLTSSERKELAEAFVAAASGRLPVIVQVGHNSLTESRSLAAHAAACGADMISANAPSYFKPDSEEALCECMRMIAEGAPSLPFYYYHIPALTGGPMDMVRFLEAGAASFPSLAGIKFSDTFVPDFQACRAFDGGRYDILWGCDEMLLSSLVVGAEGAVGSTFNIAAPLFHKIMEDVKRGDLESARAHMLTGVEMVRLLLRFGRPTVAIKEVVWPLRGLALGPSRPPLRPLAPEGADALRRAWIEAGMEEKTTLGGSLAVR